MVQRRNAERPASDRIGRLKELSTACGKACEGFVVDWNDRSSEKARSRLDRVTKILAGMSTKLIVPRRGTSSRRDGT